MEPRGATHGKKLMCQAAPMKGVVKRQGLTDITQLEGSTLRKKQGQRRK